MTQCAQCGEANPASARFCMACGSALEAVCPSCGTPAPEGARFCMECGAALAGDPDTAVARAPGVAGAAAPSLEERRTATILFADLSGYTNFAENLDPEAVKGRLSEILAELAIEVERYGGHVDKFIGDNIMAVFGAPQAHGDDPQRAVRAALGMQAAMEDLNASFAAGAFQLRVGINTGEVMAGQVGASYTVIGDSVNVAARLQAAAAPGTVIVGERTYLATREEVDYEPLPEPLQLKGKSEAVSAWEARSIAGSSTRPLSASTPLLGRESELSRMCELIERVESNGEPHLLTLIGEAGVGKSRLADEFTLRAEAERPGLLVRRGRCLAYGTSISYWPLTEVVRAECGIGEGDPQPLARQKLADRLGQLLGPGSSSGESAAPSIALIGRLLGIEAGPDTGAEEDPQRARERLFAAVRDIVEGLSRSSPLVLVWEDIHWADEGMLDLIEHLGRALRTPVLQLCLAREELLERRPGWGGVRRDATTMFLEPLSEEDGRALVAALLDGDGARELVGTVAARAGGNPLFTEELVRHLSGRGASVELPATVQGLLAARLDSLEPRARRTLGHAAVVGRTFDEQLLADLAGLGHDELPDVLAELRERNLLVAGQPAGDSGDSGEAVLTFRHALIRDAAYEMLPKTTRASDHFHVGELIEARSGERIEEVVALLAEHYERAAQLGDELNLAAEEQERYRRKALRFLEMAGDAARAFYSNADAFAQYEAAGRRAGEDADALARIGEKQGDVALRLGRVDAAIAAWQRALDYHAARGDVEHVAELHRKIGAGLAHKGERKLAIEHHQQGINLIKDGEPSLVLVRLYEEAAWLYMQVGDNMLAIYASEKALRLAERLDEVRAASRAHGIFGRVFGRIGDTAKAHENLRRAVELARESDAQETVIALQALAAHVEIFDGDHRAAAESYREAFELAEQIGDVPAEIELRGALGRVAMIAGDWEQARAQSDLSAELAEREGLGGKLCLAHSLRGRLFWREGRWIDSELAFRDALELSRQIGWSEVSFDALYGLAATLEDRGDASGAEEALAQALELCERAGLIVQSIQATTARTRLLAAANDQRAGELAAAAQEAAANVPYPIGEAAATEASGIASAGEESREQLARARDAWRGLERPLDAARCEMLLAERLLDGDGDGAVAALGRVAADYDALGIEHLAARAREIAAAQAPSS